jgi:hypothetical protein
MEAGKKEIRFMSVPSVDTTLQAYSLHANRPASPLARRCEPEGEEMNLSPGLFRAWIVLSILWTLGTVALAASLLPDKVRSDRYQYVYVLREDVEPWEVNWERPLYEIMQAPSQVQAPPMFSEVDWEYVEQWDREVESGSMLLIHDAGKLYLSAALTPDDRRHLTEAFGNERWKRWGWALLPWVGIVVGPPVALLMLGAALLWVIRGFARS